MLTDEQLDIIAEALVPLFQYLEHEVIVDVANRIKNSMAYTHTAEQKAIAMHELGYSPAVIRKEAMKLLEADPEFRKQVAKNTLEHKRMIRKMINDIKRAAFRENPELIRTATEMSWNDDMTTWKMAGKELLDNSFLPTLVEAFTKQTNEQFTNLTQTTGFKGMNGFEASESLYRKELDKAMIKLCSGTFSKEEVLRDTVKTLAKSGLRTIDYESGYSMQLDTAVRLAVRTGCHQVAGEVIKQNMLNTGENLCRVSSHWGARNKGTGHANHEEWQGKVYYIKPVKDYSKEAKRIGQEKIEDLWEATGYSLDGAHENDPTGLYGYNCRHREYAWFEGISNMPDEDPEPAPKTINGKEYDYYALTQKMRAMERDIRALKRERDGLVALGMEPKELDTKIKQKTAAYKDFCKDAGMKEKSERLRYQSKTADVTKTKAWEDYKDSVLPKRNAIKKIVYHRKAKEYREMAHDIEKELDEICSKESKWSGKINIDNSIIGSGQKEWSCDITLASNSEYSDLLHELIHARSVSYYGEKQYIESHNIEEATVELLTEEFCKKERIEYTNSYIEEVKHLRRINRRAKLYKSDYDFSKELINVDMPDRIQWLIEKVNERYVQGIIGIKDIDNIFESFSALMEEYKE